MLFNGQDPVDLHPGISVKKETPPGSVTSKLETLSGAFGELVVGRTIQQGEYKVEFLIRSNTSEMIGTIRQLLSSWARPMDVTTCELIPSDMPDRAYAAMCKKVGEPKFKHGAATIEIVFALPRPIAHDRFPRTASTGDKAEALAVDVRGSSYIRPEVSMKLPSAADAVTLYVDDKAYFRLVASLSAGDCVIIREDASIDMFDASANAIANAATCVDYVVTDLFAMWKALGHGPHTVRCEPACSIEMKWRDEWV